MAGARTRRGPGQAHRLRRRLSPGRRRRPGDHGAGAPRGGVARVPDRHHGQRRSGHSACRGGPGPGTGPLGPLPSHGAGPPHPQLREGRRGPPVHLLGPAAGLRDELVLRTGVRHSPGPGLPQRLGRGSPVDRVDARPPVPGRLPSRRGGRAGMAGPAGNQRGGYPRRERGPHRHAVRYPGPAAPGRIRPDARRADHLLPLPVGARRRRERGAGPQDRCGPGGLQPWAEHRPDGAGQVERDHRARRCLPGRCGQAPGRGRHRRAGGRRSRPEGPAEAVRPRLREAADRAVPHRVPRPGSRGRPADRRGRPRRRRGP